MSDAFYVTAQAEGGPTCFLALRSLPNGSHNGFLIQRLKDKCGNRSNASSEVEFRDTLGWALCEEGRGIRTAIGTAHRPPPSGVMTPVAKYWNCKRAPAFVHEALECHGGNGFIEEHPMARLYREAPLNGIWEGSGNLIPLDVLRALRKSPEALDAVVDEVALARGGDSRLDRDLPLMVAEARTAMNGVYGVLPGEADCGTILARAWTETA